jgi:hypothetical protein
MHTTPSHEHAITNLLVIVSKSKQGIGALCSDSNVAGPTRSICAYLQKLPEVQLNGISSFCTISNQHQTIQNPTFYFSISFPGQGISAASFPSGAMLAGLASETLFTSNATTKARPLMPILVVQDWFHSYQLIFYTKKIFKSDQEKLNSHLKRANF